MNACIGTGVGTVVATGARAGGIVVGFGACIDMRAGFVSVVAAGACVGSGLLRCVARGVVARKHRRIIALRGPKAQQNNCTQSPAHDGCTTCVSLCGSLPGWRTENGVGGVGSCSMRYDEQNLGGAGSLSVLHMSIDNPDRIPTRKPCFRHGIQSGKSVPGPPIPPK